MAEIQRFPQGLLQFLGLHTSGITPGEVSPVLATVLDVKNFYSANRLETEIASNNVANAVGDNVFLTVPDRETWLVYSVGAGITYLTAGDNVTVDFKVLTGPILAGQGAVPIADRFKPGAASAAPQTFSKNGFNLGVPWVLPAASQFELVITEITAITGNVGLRIDALVARYGPPTEQ